MTKEQQSLQELGRTPEEMAAKTAEMDRIAREAKGVPTVKITKRADGFEEVTGFAKTRRPAVKGVCVNCGKNWSRHFGHDKSGCEIPYCTKACETVFSIAPAPRKPEPAQAGGLSDAQIDRIKELMEAREQALDANTKAEEAMLRACADFEQYLQSLKAQA